MSIAIVTDSTAYLTPEQYKEEGIYRIPLSVIMDNKVYKEEEDISAAEFFDQTRNVKRLPTSSQPTVGDFYSLYERLGKEYDAIISIHLSSKISGTYQNASSVANSMENIQVYPYDSGVTCAAQGFLALKAAEMAQAGASVEEILQVLNQMREESDTYFVVDNLTNLVKGGRLSQTAGTVGTLLKIKPVLYFKDKKIDVYDKIRTKKKSLKRIEELFEEAVQNTPYPLQASIVHANSPEEGAEWKKKLEKTYPSVKFDLSYFGPVIGVHVGEKALGLTWTIDPEYKKK